VEKKHKYKKMMDHMKSSSVVNSNDDGENKMICLCGKLFSSLLHGTDHRDDEDNDLLE
jgi:hypothetical protein